jgi:hypothetical protein
MRILPRYSLIKFFAIILACVPAATAGASSTTHKITATANGFAIEFVSAVEDVRYEWTAPAPGTMYSAGSIVVTDSVGGQSVQGQIPLSSGIDWIGGAEVLQSTVPQTTNGISETLVFSKAGAITHLTLTPIVDGVFAGIKFAADQPTIQDIYIGGLPSTLQSNPVSVPYYSQAVNYLSSLDLFENSFFEPFASHATTLSNTTAPKTFYAANANGAYNVLSDVWKISVSVNILNVLPYPEHPASPYMSALAGRLFLDIKGGAFETIASQLRNLGDYGVTNCVAIVGNWQHYGYDDALPAQYPANAALGGDTGMRDLGAAARANSCLFALHQNYVDYYPDYPYYTPSAVMRNADGSLMTSWLNPSTGLQAYAAKPGVFVPNAKTQSPYSHSAYGTNASFIDVNSSATPWWRADKDPAGPGSGMFAPYRDNSIALWGYERSVEGGPVFGEGKNHWFWSGLLDGVEAQFGAEAVPISSGPAAPLFVDFDLTRIHPLQVNYGMGYYNRWTPGATIAATLALDAYRMQEVIFGHAPYLTDSLWSSVPRALLEQNLVSPLAARSAQQTASAVAYLVNGAWADASAAAKAGQFSVAKVTYSNGDSVVANSSSTGLSWGSLQIPQYGWAAMGKDYLAYTALVGGQLADYSQTPQAIYANARNQADILSENTLATPEVIILRETAPRTIQIQLAWNVNTPDPLTNYGEFIHFVSTALPGSTNSVSAGTGSTLSVLTSAWTTGQRVLDNMLTYTFPSTLSDGSYQVRVGLFSGARRAVLYGNNDGNLRYNVGTITLSNNGASIAFTPAPIVIASPDPRLNNAGQVVDFGSLRTDGMVYLAQQASGTSTTIKLSAYPRSRDVLIQFNPSSVPMPASLTCDNGDVIVPAVDSGGYWRVDLRARKYCSWTAAAQ